MERIAGSGCGHDSTHLAKKNFLMRAKQAMVSIFICLKVKKSATHSAQEATMPWSRNQ